jgi:hypothetical protein
MDGFGHRTLPRRRMLEVDMLEDRLLLSGSSIAPVQPVPAPIPGSAIYSSSVAANHLEVFYAGRSSQHGMTQAVGQSPSINNTPGSYSAQQSSRSEGTWANGPSNVPPGVSSYARDDDSDDHAADKDQGIDLGRANLHETTASSIPSLLLARLEQIGNSPGTTGEVSPASPADTLALGQPPPLPPALPGGTVPHVPPMLTAPADPNMETGPLDQIGESRLAQMNPADMAGAEQPQSGHESQRVLREAFAGVAETLSADWDHLREEVGVFFIHLGQMGSWDTGWWNAGMVVPWLMVATTVALEMARRQRNQAPLALPDEVACRLDFFAENEEP